MQAVAGRPGWEQEKEKKQAGRGRKRISFHPSPSSQVLEAFKNKEKKMASVFPPS